MSSRLGKKISKYVMSHLKLIFVIASAVFIGFFSAMSVSQIKVPSLKLEVEEIPQVNQQKFIEKIISRVKKDYVEEKTDRELYESAASGVLSALDPHSSYLNEASLKEMRVQTKGEFGGVGIEITMEYSVIKIITAIDDTPASSVGIKSGDYIVKIDGESVAGLSLTEVVKKLRGKPGTKVNVTILRKGEKEPLEKTIKREIIKIKAVKSAKLGDVAYVKISTFSQQTHEGIVKEIKKLKEEIGEKDLKGLVIDLRNNPGGLLDQAVKVSDAFLPKGSLIVSIKGRGDESDDFFDSENENLVEGLPIAVLVNEGSASASEIVAGALQDNHRAIIMGKKSFGKGSVQTIIPVSENNGAIRLTTALYYTPSGKSIQAHGIEPDIEVENAKIEEEKLKLDSEADLRGHIEVRIKETIDEANKEKMTDDNLDLYKKDYQLARATDLVRGAYIAKSLGHKK